MEQEGYFAIKDIEGYTWSYYPSREELYIDPMFPGEIEVLCDWDVTLDEAVEYVCQSSGGVASTRFISTESVT